MLFYSNVVGRAVIRQEIVDGVGYLYFSDGTSIQVDASELYDDEDLRVDVDEQTGSHYIVSPIK